LSKMYKIMTEIFYLRFFKFMQGVILCGNDLTWSFQL
jgi:hypothetical protein